MEKIKQKAILGYGTVNQESQEGGKGICVELIATCRTFFHFLNKTFRYQSTWVLGGIERL